MPSSDLLPSNQSDRQTMTNDKNMSMNHQADSYTESISDSSIFNGNVSNCDTSDSSHQPVTKDEKTHTSVPPAVLSPAYVRQAASQFTVVEVNQPSRPPWYYRLAIGLLKPLYRLQVWIRSHRHENYKLEVAQRFGQQYPPAPTNSQMFGEANKGVIWCHAVSLGETNTIAPLLKLLLQQGYGIWLTNTTHTGYDRGEQLFAGEIMAGQVSHSYVPVDSSGVLDKFLAHVQPIAALFVETELWATMLSKLAMQSIPAMLVNARLSESSFERYQKIAKVSRSMMDNLALIIAQDDMSAKRFRQLGASSAKIRLAGSLKWVISNASHNKDIDGSISDVDNVTDVDSATHVANRPTRPIWVAGSTHAGEETLAIQAHQQLLTKVNLQDALLIIVPRHPERFDEVANLLAQSGLTVARRSQNEPIQPETQVYLADSMGELMHWYQWADVALVGGSLVDIGGHNPIEPLSVATPVIMGQYTQTCQPIVDKLQSAGALFQLGMSDKSHQDKISQQQLISQLSSQLTVWLGQPSLAKQAGLAGQTEVQQHQAILPRQLAMIEETIAKYQNVKPNYS